MIRTCNFSKKEFGIDIMPRSLSGHYSKIILHAGFILLWVSVVSTLTMGQDVHLVLRQALLDARSVSNIEVQIESETQLQPGLKGAGSNYAQGYSSIKRLLYIASGTKYYTECIVNDSINSGSQHYETAFDGTSYSGIDDVTLYMIKYDGDARCDDSPNPLNPMAAPFVFLGKGGKTNECMLRFTDLDPKLFEETDLLEVSNNDGILSFKVPDRIGGTALWAITAPNLPDRFTPTTITETILGQMEICYNFSDYTNIGAFWFPRKVYVTVTNDIALSPALALSSKTIIKTIKIPEKILDSVFKLDQSKATSVWNPRQQKMMKTSAQLKSLQRKRNTSRVVALSIFVTSCGTAVWMIYRKIVQKNRAGAA